MSNFRNSDTKICSRNISKDAARAFMADRYPRYETCDKPCTDMDIRTNLVSKSKMGKPQISSMFGKTVPVSREVLSHSLFNLIAEIGGYLGLTLGLSLMHLQLPLKMFWQQILFWAQSKKEAGVPSS